MTSMIFSCGLRLSTDETLLRNNGTTVLNTTVSDFLHIASASSVENLVVRLFEEWGFFQPSKSLTSAKLHFDNSNISLLQSSPSFDKALLSPGISNLSPWWQGSNK